MSDDHLLRHILSEASAFTLATGLDHRAGLFVRVIGTLIIGILKQKCFRLLAHSIVKAVRFLEHAQLLLPLLQPPRHPSHPNLALIVLSIQLFAPFYGQLPLTFRLVFRHVTQLFRHALEHLLPLDGVKFPRTGLGPLS